MAFALASLGLKSGISIAAAYLVQAVLYLSDL
jgi:hypothetical protein